jgi:methionine-rich copper-binding protein CopC
VVPVRPHARGAAAAVLTLLLVGVASALGAAPAAAHNYLVSTTPKADATIASAPGEVQLVFNDVVRNTGSAVVVKGPDGRRWESGPAEIIGDKVTQPLEPLGPAGRYEIEYRVVSADGHPVTGTLGFELSAPGPGGAAAAPQAAASGTAAATTTPSHQGHEETTPAAAPAAAGGPADGEGGVMWWLPVVVIAVLAGLGGLAVAVRRKGPISDDD